MNFRFEAWYAIYGFLYPKVVQKENLSTSGIAP